MSDPAANNEVSVALIGLMKGVVERDTAAVPWQGLVAHQARVRDHLAVLGLELVLDEAEGYAYLRQRPAVEGEAELPRLVARRPLSYRLSLMLALLRKKLAEFDAASGDTRLVVTAGEIADMLRLFLRDTANEAKLKDGIDRDIGKVVDMGFLRPLKGQIDTYEVRRILRSFVDAQWLGQLNERLGAYAAHAREGGGEEARAAHD
jgi:hypothetical protein